MNTMSRLLLIAALSLLSCRAFASGTFFWTCESETLGANDYSAGDTTATASGGISISSSSPLKGSNSCLTTNANDFYVFSPTSIVNNAEMGFAAMFRWASGLPSSNTFSKPLGAVDTADLDRVGLTTEAAGDSPRLLIQKDGVSARTLTLTTNMAADTTYFLTGAYDIAGDRRYVRLYDSSCTLIEESVDTTTDLSGDQPGTLNEIHAGNNSGTAFVLRADTFIYVNDYDDNMAPACAWTTYKPSYTSGPTNGTFTNTTLPFTYTSAHTGTTYAAACTNGQTVTSFANLKSGTCSGGAAVGTGTDTNTQTVGDTVTIVGLSPSTTYDVYVGQENTLGWQSDISSLADRATTGGSITFTAGPNEAPATDGFTISGTITGAGTLTVEAVWCNTGDAAPNNAELESGQCGGGNAAIANASEVWTTGVANDFLLTASNKPVRADIYVAGTDGTTDTAVSGLLDQDRSIRSGFLIGVMGPPAPTGVCDLDSYFDPDCAAGDVFEYEDDTNENANCNVSFEADGDFVLTPVAAGDCDGKRTFNISYQDVSSETTGLFTAPAIGNFTTDDVICNGNTAPVGLDGWEVPIVWTEDVAITALDLTAYFSDADGDSLTFSLASGSWPPGVTQSGAGGKDVTGTPNTENESGVALTVAATDDCGDSGTFDFYDGGDADIYVINQWLVPNLNNLPPSEAEDVIVASAPWRINDPGLSISGYVCGTGQEFLNIATQSPAAAGAATAYQVINVNIVGALLPDVAGMTAAEAMAAIEAVCP